MTSPTAGSNWSVFFMCIATWSAVFLSGSVHAAPADKAWSNLRHAVVVAPSNAGTPEQKAVAMLIDEVEKRTRIRLSVSPTWPDAAEAVIAVGMNPALAACAKPVASQIEGQKPKGAEGYVLSTLDGAPCPTVAVVGADARGVLFGVGRLLRELRMTRDSIEAPASLAINTAPVVGLRGHQLGYRPKVNTYDGWTVPMWEQYFRDLIVFGTNAVEFMPPKTDDDADSPHFPLPQMEMLTKLSQLADDYSLSVWMWYPAMEKDYTDPATVDKALAEWGAVFEKMPRIDAVFVPGGDPGHTKPDVLMKFLEKETAVLHRTHPNATMWMSPQGFTKAWMDEFLEIIQKQQPTWLTGIVFGPQARLPLPELRKAIPSQYPIRHYPDITHSYGCQYPVHDWDVAYKLTQDREVVNPRPEAYSRIFRWSLPYTNGFISYSEGCNDDVNKMLWSALGWDPESNVTQILREYARYFIGPEFEDGYAQALVSLERNWEGPLLTNAGVTATLQQVQAMEAAASPQVKLNWRFQQTLYRAYYDAFVRRRLIYETELQERAMEALGRAGKIGSMLALDEAESSIDRAVLEPVGQELRGRVSEVAEALYNSIRMQLSVPRFLAIDAGRGANFDLIDEPLNDRYSLKTAFAKLRALSSESERLKGIREIVEWTNPGPGGFYDDLGNPSMQPHLVRNLTTDFDPEYRVQPLVGYEDEFRDQRTSWITEAQSRFEAPLKMHYDNLDAKGKYKVRAVYAGDKMDAQIRLLANDSIEIHPLIHKENPLKPVEFDIPVEATAGGQLTLTWYQEPGRGGAGRGCQIAEVWLIKKTEK